MGQSFGRPASQRAQRTERADQFRARISRACRREHLAPLYAGYDENVNDKVRFFARLQHCAAYAQLTVAHEVHICMPLFEPPSRLAKEMLRSYTTKLIACEI